jgi:hypothetical protein
VDFNSFFAIFIEKSPLTLFAMLANKDYQKSGLFDQNRKNLIFSHVPSVDDLSTEKIYKGNTNNTWEKMASGKVMVQKVSNSSGNVIVKGDDGVEYAGDAGLGKPLDGLHFYSSNSSDAIEFEVLTPSPYRFYTGVTDGYWKDLVPKGTKCLILKMENGCLVRNMAKDGEELKAEEVNANFLTVNGIDYKSNNAKHALIYMVI